jgi:RNA polymerase sigma-70 factor (ECF subfamily)
VAEVEDDKALVERANAGDEDAFEELYRRHRNWVVALAHRFTRDRDEALDVLQDSFAYLLAKFPGFELTASLRAFLYPVVKNLSLDRIRRRRPTVDVSELADELPAVEAPSLSDVGRILATLPETHREVVLLRFVDDLRLQDIAAALGIPLGTVKSRLHYAIEALRRGRAGEQP